VASAACDLADPDALATLPWKEILAQTKLKADSTHVYEKELKGAGEVTHARFNIYPDGGVARLRIFGKISKGFSQP
jgi:allantoicase